MTALTSRALESRGRLARARQTRGVATLTVAILLLFIITVAALFVNRSQIFDLRVATNHYRYTQAYEMAERGLEVNVAWLQSRASIPDDQNITRLPGQPLTCLTNQVIPLRYAAWECDSVDTAKRHERCDMYEYMKAGDICNPGFPSSIPADPANGVAFNVNVRVRRLKGQTLERYRLEIISESSGDGQGSSASVRQSVAIHPMPGRIIPPNPGVPILVRDVVSVRTKPKTCSPACTGSNGYAVATLQDNLDNFSARTKTLFAEANPPVNVLTLGLPDFTVFDILFRGVSQCDMLDLSEAQRTMFANASDRTVFFFGSCGGRMGYSLPSNNNLISVTGTGSTTRPIIVIVSATDTYTSAKQCPSINNTVSSGSLYGIFYFGRDCDANGIGNSKVEGTIAVEGSLLNMNSTATFGYNPLTHTTSDYDVISGVGNLPQGRLARIPGSWRDY